jgi:putative membrane protein
MAEQPRAGELRDYLAAERTFLAWVRTGIALMGFGFVVARFGLFLQQLRIIERSVPLPSSGLSLWFGTALIAVGVIVHVVGAWRHVVLVRELNAGGPLGPRTATQVVAIAAFLAVVGVTMAVYLVVIRATTSGPPPPATVERGL